MTLLEEGHEGVSLNREETVKLACWIDLVVPYCGDYVEANAWLPFERARYDRFLAKRKKMAAIEERNIGELSSSQRSRAPGEEVVSAVKLTAEVTSTDGQVLVQRQGSAAPRSPLVVDLPRPLQRGDRICVQGARHLAVQLAPNLSEALIHVPDGRLEWTVPYEENRIPSGNTPYPPSAFQPERPRLTLRPVALAELDVYRNIAANPYDLGGTVATFPHAKANSEGRNAPVHAARNAIDDQLRNDSHGGWPCQSWEPGRAETPWWQVDFGRSVEIDKVVIVPRADFAHDGYWQQATLVFSDGHRRTIALEKNAQPQIFTFESRRTSSLRLADLIQGEPPGRCALTEVQVWGRDRIPVAEDLSAPAP